MKMQSMVLDRYDRHILALLQQDGGLSNLQLAERVGLSPSPCSRRVQKLEEAGVIRGRATLLDSKALGLGLTVMIQISMDRHTPERFENFEATVRGFEEVQQCYLVTGQSADSAQGGGARHGQLPGFPARQDHAHRGRQRRAFQLRHAQGGGHHGAAAELSVDG